MEDIYFTIDLIPITKKNHQQIVYIKKKFREGTKHQEKILPRVIPSAQYRKYEEEAGKFIPKLHLDCKCNVKAIYHMPTRRRCDLVNLHEALCDVLVKWGCIEDDDWKHIASMDGSCVKVGSKNPRTEVWIERLE